MSISKKVRFETLKRDDFTCQYCGAKPPDVELEVDHIIPRGSGGSNRPDNLKTSCRDCNARKSNTLIDVLTADREEVRAHHKQLAGEYFWRDPVFQQGLRSLVTVHEYSDDDIGMMLGVSRERVRQWRNMIGIKKLRRGSGSLRRFDWVGCRFVVMDSKDAYKYLKARERGRWRVARQAQRDRVVAWMIVFTKKYGYPPSCCQIADDMGLNHVENLYMWLGYRVGKNKAIKVTDKLYDEAGLEKRKVGHKGHNATLAAV